MNPLPMVTKLLHTRYRVNDLEKTVAFYKDVLGLEEIKRHKSPRGSELVFLKTPNSDELIEICFYPASGRPHRYRPRPDPPRLRSRRPHRLRRTRRRQRLPPL
jgi:catechol 2,3-dioxygenase-like lactoylglutathione lyase family enzyme